jgi:hypothetical protein
MQSERTSLMSLRNILHLHGLIERQYPAESRQPCLAYYSTLKMEAKCLFAMLVDFDQIIWLYVTENSALLD